MRRRVLPIDAVSFRARADTVSMQMLLGLWHRSFLISNFKSPSFEGLFCKLLFAFYNFCLFGHFPLAIAVETVVK